MNRNLAIAQRMAEHVKDSKRPYADLKWMAENIYDGKEWEAYFIAVRILKESGVENAPRKPLTELTAKERKQVRDAAKQIAKLLSEYLKMPVSVTRMPLQSFRGDTEPRLQIKFERKKGWASYIYPSASELKEFASLDGDSQIVRIYRYAQGFKSRDAHIAENMETIKADLDSVFGVP